MREGGKKSKIKPSSHSSRFYRTNLCFCLKFWHHFGSFQLNLKIKKKTVKEFINFEK